MKIKSLHIYPIKSMSGISVSEAELLETGFKYDRHWMVVDQDGNFMTQRKHPKLTLFSPHIGSESLKLSFHGDSIKFNLDASLGIDMNVNIWDHKNIAAIEVDPKVSHWISGKLNFNCHLVKMAINGERKKKLPDSKEVDIKFADGYPYLILGTASVDYLQKELDISIKPNRFRPNILVETNAPHEEDNWKKLSQGNIEFEIVKPCARCVIPTINQETGIKNPTINRVLATYRNQENNILFGINAIAIKKGMLSISDELNIVSHNV